MNEDDEKQYHSMYITLETTSENILQSKEGWLKKKTSSFFSKWPRRYFVLENHCLFCYSSPRKTKFLGGVDFNKISVSISSNDNIKEISILPLSGKKTVRLRFLSLCDYQDWLEKISTQIHSAKGNKIKLTDYPLWGLSRISNNEFLRSANTGDLILFKTKKIGNALQRFICLSDYDHVGVLFKYNSGDIAFFESTKENGVSMCYWDEFMLYRWFEIYSKISYRKLIVENRKEINQKMDKFILDTLGKKFSFNARKFICRFNRGLKCEDQGFFCSELVAKTFQELGLMSGRLAASTYWPGDFSDNKKLPLINCKFQYEQIIDFSLKKSVLSV